MQVYLGSICPYALNFAPKDWATCQGQIVAIASNTALFSLLGVNYGGNGTTTFGLPNLQGRAALGQGQGPVTSSYVMGQAGGATSVTLNNTTLPTHSHSISVEVQGNGTTGSTASPAGKFLAEPEVAGVINTIYSGSTNCNMAAGTVAIAPSAGGSNPIPIESPYLAITYCIATAGLFPPRA